MRKIIYLDYAATTPVLAAVKKAMEPYLSKEYGNPSSIYYSLGRQAKAAVVEARKTVAQILGAQSKEIIFTSSGSESINLALKGVAWANQKRGRHLVTSQIEHHAVLETYEFLKKQGFKVTYLPVDKYGLVNPHDVEKTIKKETILVSIMYANNEIGTIQPISEIGRICRSQKVYFHTDACQAAGFLSLNVAQLNVDLLTINGSKIYGPKGIGVLYVKSGTKIYPLIHGGQQERGLRAGTENVAGIVGLAKALLLVQQQRKTENLRLQKLRDYFIEQLTREIKGLALNGHPFKRLPNNVNVTIKGVSGEDLLIALDKQGICASTGAACTLGSAQPSSVLLAIGRSKKAAQSNLRLTLGRINSKKDIDEVMQVLPPIIRILRQQQYGKK